jgi:hypothetical protein
VVWVFSKPTFEDKHAGQGVLLSQNAEGFFAMRDYESNNKYI